MLAGDAHFMCVRKGEREGGREGGKERKKERKEEKERKRKKQIPPATIQTAPYIYPNLSRRTVGPSHWRFSRLASSIASGPAVEQGHGKKKPMKREFASGTGVWGIFWRPLHLSVSISRGRG